MKELLVVHLCVFFFHVNGLTLDLPKNIEVIEKNDVVVSCNVTDYNGNIDAIKFFWTKFFQVIQTDQILRIILIEPNQSGTYTCYAIADGVTYNSSVEITVFYAPSWVEGVLRKYSGAPGSSATLNCTIDSFPSPSFTWINTDNSSITSSNMKYIINNLSNRSTLTINNVVQNDYGAYVCEAENKAGKRSYGIQLLMPGPPDSPQLCESTLIVSDSITMICLEGYKGVTDRVEYSIRMYSASNIQIQTTFATTRLNSSAILLEVTGLSSKQEYTLDVYAGNGHGISSEPFSLYFTTAPGTLIITTGSPDNSKVVALAVCIPLLVIAIVAISLAVMYKYHLKKKNMSRDAEVLTFQQALCKFPSSSSITKLNNDHKELMNLHPSIHPSENNAHTNPAFIGDESSDRTDKPQPSLAGCGALQPLKVVHPPAEIKFVPGRTRPEDRGDGRQNIYVQTTPPPSISDSWEFPRNKFYIRRRLGDGSFGEVWEARIESGQDETGGRIVAVKMLKDNFTDDEQQMMLDDMKIMKSIGFHPNIIQLIGCCTTSYPLCMIYEYASRGTLLNLLRQQRSTSGIRLTTKDIESFTLQIASAMEHIASQKLLHRDLATRSILVTNDLVCKLADFEKEMHLQDLNNTQKRKSHRIQIRWLPPESMFVLEKSVKSNIWSFGILIWECFTLGSTPYPGMNNKEVVDFVQRGGRMPKPNFCSQAMYEVIQDCWIYYPHRRATFTELRREIQKVYESNPTQDMDFVTGEYDSKSWNASPQDLGEFV